MVAFLAIETRVEEPLLPLRIFRLRTVAGANAVALLLGARQGGWRVEVVGENAEESPYVAMPAPSIAELAVAG